MKARDAKEKKGKMNAREKKGKRNAKEKKDLKPEWMSERGPENRQMNKEKDTRNEI